MTLFVVCFIRKKSVNHWKVRWTERGFASSKYTLCYLDFVVCARLAHYSSSLCPFRHEKSVENSLKHTNVDPTNTKLRDCCYTEQANWWWKKLCSTFGSFAFFTSLRCFVIHFTSWRKTHTEALKRSSTKEKRENLLGTIMKCVELFFTQPKMRTEKKWKVIALFLLLLDIFSLNERKCFLFPPQLSTSDIN